MKLQEQNRALTKRDLVTKLAKVEKALGAQAQRADAAERDRDRLLCEVIRLNSERGLLKTGA